MSGKFTDNKWKSVSYDDKESSYEYYHSVFPSLKITVDDTGEIPSDKPGVRINPHKLIVKLNKSGKGVTAEFRYIERFEEHLEEIFKELLQHKENKKIVISKLLT